MKRIKWSEEERAILAELVGRKSMRKLNFQYGTSHRDYAVLAFHLNDMYHNGVPIRTESSVKAQCNAQRAFMPGYHHHCD